MEIENRNQPQDEFNLNASGQRVAEQLIDAKFLVGKKTITVTEADFYTREENEIWPYHVVIGLNPGLIVGVPHRGAVIPLVTALEGECVKLHSVGVAEENKRVKAIKGHPGIIARELGLESGEIRQIIVEDAVGKILRLD